MRLLIVTQKVDSNDDVLGFMHSWIAEFAKHCESVTVICLQAGEHQLPDNVRILSLGKENGHSKIKYLFNFYRYIWRERDNYDVVFVHMNQMYVILGWPLWALLRKNITLWYAHGHVSWSLRIAARLAHRIFTSTASGFRLSSNKVVIVGQGIDTEYFSLRSDAPRSAQAVFHVVSVGRIAPTKDYETLIRAVEMLVARGVRLSVAIIGGPITVRDSAYYRQLQVLVQQKNLTDTIIFSGSLAHRAIVPHLQKADLFVTMSRTGSLDKAILEAMSCGVPVIACNEAMPDVLGTYATELMYESGNATQLADRIAVCMSWSADERMRISHALRNIVVSRHGLPQFITTITSSLRLL